MPNVSILSIPVFFLITLAPHLYTTNMLNIRKKYRNTNPRTTSPEIYKTALPPALQGRYERGRAAHANGNEAFPLFIAAVVIGNAANVAGIDFLVSLALALRTAYTVLYVVTESESASWWRTSVWMAEKAVFIGVFAKAAFKHGF